MKKSNTAWLVPSESEGWDYWQLSKGNLEQKGTSLGKIPKGSYTVMLPVKYYRSSLERVYSGDLEAEQMSVITAGLVQEGEASKESDFAAVKILEKDEFSIYNRYVLEKIPCEKAWIDCQFVTSASRFNIEQGILFWFEQGRWVYACYYKGENIYSDVLAAGNLSKQLNGLLGLLKIHFQMASIPFEMKEAWVLSEICDSELAECSSALGITVKLGEIDEVQKFTEETFSFIPDPVLQWRRKRTIEGRRAKLLVLLFFAFLGTVAFLFWQMNELKTEIAEYEEVVERYSPVTNSNQLIMDKWDELELVTTDKWPLTNYSAVVKEIPGIRQIRIESLEVRPGFISISGKAPVLGPANALGSGLKRLPEFIDYEWTNRAPSKSADKKTWTFRFEGNRKLEGIE